MTIGKSQYLITKVSNCPHCDGIGFITSRRHPPGEIECHFCKGTGEFITKVTLREALNDLGIQIPKEE